MAKIIIKDLHKKFKRANVLNGLSFQIENEILFIAGRNGAGKTTLLRLLLNMERQDKGFIEIKDDVTNASENICCVFDSTCLYQDMNCSENISILGTGYLNDKAHIDRIIDSLQIKELLHKKVGRCSFGQQHRISMAIALIRKPVFLLLDEPTVGLDPMSWELVRAAVLANKNEQNGCVIITGQDYDALCDISDKILVLSDGISKFYGTPNELLSAHRSDENGVQSCKDLLIKLLNNGD